MKRVKREPTEVSADLEGWLKRLGTGNEAELLPLALAAASLAVSDPQDRHTLAQALRGFVEDPRVPMAAELAIKALVRLEEGEETNAFILEAVARPSCPPTVLQQAFRTLAPGATGIIRTGLVHLAVDAVGDVQSLTRALCLNVLSKLCTLEESAQLGLVEGLAEFALSDPTEEVRAAALEALIPMTALGLAKGWRVACSALQDDGSSVRDAAARLLGALAAPDRFAGEMEPDSVTGVSLVDGVFELLGAAACDPDQRVRCTAAGLLGTLEGCSPTLVLQAMSKKPLSRGSDRKMHRKSRVVGIFVHALEEEFANVRTAAIRSLKRLGTSCGAPVRGEALEHVADMLHDESGAVRLEAIAALSALGSLRADHLRSLLFLLAEEDATVRGSVEALLGCAIHPDAASFRDSGVGLLQALVRFPQDLDRVCSALAGMGNRHAQLAELMVEPLLGLDPRFILQERLVTDGSYFATLVLLLCAAERQPSLLTHLPASILRHAPYVRAQAPHLFATTTKKDEEDAEELLSVPLLLVLQRARALRRAGHGSAAQALLRASQSRADRVGTLLLRGCEEAAVELEQGFALPTSAASEWSSILLAMQQGQDWEIPKSSLPIPRPLLASLAVVPEFANEEFVGLVSFPVLVRCTVLCGPAELGSLALVAVFPDRSADVFEFPESLATGEPIAMRLMLRPRQTVWTSRCAVHLWVVRRFKGTQMIGMNPNPSGVSGGMVAISAPSVVFMRPVVRR